MMNLADPELELIDPTPNVHSMFLHFDKTFFWATLSSRCIVRWSKRMYSCAGICSYEGSGGLCDIALSEPLLKLRPRRDLVETLLHEMIHAFLFVTRRDQDRDGHGPNFKAHMHRINRAAGLNISIYHDFHDEVKMYQTHWWRCNGPCQFHRPYFGIVRRSNNRAPGPSDYWWNRHQRNCGGTFIKIKEPDKPEKKNKKTSVVKPNVDITKYIHVNNNNNNNNNKASNKSIIQNDKIKKAVLKDSSNVLGKPKVGGKSNNSSTLVVTKKNVIFSPQMPKSKLVVFNGKGLAIGTEQRNNVERKKTNSTNVLETVRNIWANKQISTNNIKHTPKDNNSNLASNLNKHKPDNHAESPHHKMKKIEDYFKTAAASVLKDLYGQNFNITLTSKNDQKLKAIPEKNNFVECPVCNSRIYSEINKHLDECLNKDVIENLVKGSGPVSKKQSNVNVKDSYQGERSQLGELSRVVSEPVFKKEGKDLNHNTSSSFINKHVKNTIGSDLNKIGFVTKVNRKRSRTSLGQSDLRLTKTIGEINDKNSKIRKSDNFTTTACLVQTSPILIDPPVKIEPGCGKSGTTSEIKTEPGCSKPDITLKTACPCCGDQLNKSVDEHLDECLSFFENNTTIPEEGTSTSYTTIVIDDDDEFDESQTLNATGTKLPCPCCLTMIEEIDMNNHLDECLS